jgi:hypothetical protein
MSASILPHHSTAVIRKLPHEKSKGKEIVIDKAPEPKYGQVIMEALKRSMERLPAKKENRGNGAG